jgi:hypothetical protein
MDQAKNGLYKKVAGDDVKMSTSYYLDTKRPKVKLSLCTRQGSRLRRFGVGILATPVPITPVSSRYLPIAHKRLSPFRSETLQTTFPFIRNAAQLCFAVKAALRARSR